MNQVHIAEEELAENNGMDAERIEFPREKLTEGDQLGNLTHPSLLQIEPREKLPKAKFDNQLK